jgi:hypothetical protein
MSWDSGVIESAENVHVAYAGPALEILQIFWRVRVTFKR